ncbi:MAG: c-type cytochrome [Chloroflexi bacterium]|nr:c-type cytochrome [Chloroflexota bacterium]
MQKENYDRYVWIGLVLTLIVIGLMTFAWLGESARLVEAADTTSKAYVSHGRALYVDNCTSCHGTRGEGGAGNVLNSKALLTSATDDILFETIRAGRPNTTMPAWGQSNGGPLTDEDIRQVVSFLRAWEPTAPEIKVNDFVPSAVRGANIFVGSCGICHGDNGKGTNSAPALNDAARLKALDDKWYKQTIANGRPAKGMPTWGTVLSPNQIEDLVALMAAWRKGEAVAPDITVAELLNSALFSLSQNDKADAAFYLRRAKAIAFGPALQKFDPIMTLIEKDQQTQALTDLDALYKNWPIGDEAKGKKVFNDACGGCHGSDGQGGVGRKLKPNEFVKTNTNSEILTLLLTGRVNTAMRGFSGRLTEAQLADVIAYLQSWQK